MAQQIAVIDEISPALLRGAVWNRAACTVNASEMLTLQQLSWLTGDRKVAHNYYYWWLNKVASAAR